ncbi:hypothetical protein H9P43_006435 [Blastocladiella emersonii ATCC 22665]|nr:hypothetical protein H9P43_006435 [Blastocladiella emersonii ATCC 22665]
MFLRAATAAAKSATSRLTTTTSTTATPLARRFLSSTPPPPPPSSSASATASASASHPAWLRGLARFANGKQPGDRGFWTEIGVVFTVFAVTGSSSLMVVRKSLNAALGVEGSWRDGPNAWRAGYVVCGLPMYSMILLTLGTLSGRGAYFRTVLHRMYGRILPRRVADKLKP